MDPAASPDKDKANLRSPKQADLFHLNLLLYNNPACYSPLPTQHFVAHLCTSQGRSNCVFHPSPSVLHSTSADYCTLSKRYPRSGYCTSNATPLVWRSTCCPVRPLCARLADLKITPWRDTSIRDARRRAFIHSNG